MSNEDHVKLYALGKAAAENNEPGAYILNDEAALIIDDYERGSSEWHEAIGEFVSGFATERLKRMGK